MNDRQKTMGRRDFIVGSAQTGGLLLTLMSLPRPLTLRSHTIIAFLSDPKYGGNHDYIGWKVMGYPGPRHTEGGYSKEQLLGTAPIRAIWGDDV